MSKSKFILVTILILGLGGMSLYLNRDRFQREPIQISHRLSPWLKDRRSNSRASDLGIPVTFMLNGFYQLKSVRVVEAAAYQTNQNIIPVWRIVSDSNSVALSSFNYGGFIKGMRPEAKGIRPEPLHPGTTYRLLLVTDHALKAEHDFNIPAVQ